jgi:hypothetical protein
MPWTLLDMLMMSFGWLLLWLALGYFALFLPLGATNDRA